MGVKFVTKLLVKVFGVDLTSVEAENKSWYEEVFWDAYTVNILSAQK
jgi:hypothetical protein